MVDPLLDWFGFNQTSILCSFNISKVAESIQKTGGHYAVILPLNLVLSGYSFYKCSPIFGNFLCYFEYWHFLCENFCG